MSTNKDLRNKPEVYFEHIQVPGCRSSKEDIKVWMNSKKSRKERAISISDYVDFVKPFWLTLGDVKKWKSNSPIDLFIMDRNLWDVALSPDLKANHVYESKKIFKRNRHTYTPDKTATKGTLNLHYGGTEKNIIVSGFELDVLMEPNVMSKFGIKMNKGPVWTPLVSGNITEVDSKLFGVEWPEKLKNVPLTKLPLHTYIGYRGPMMLWSDVKNLPLFIAPQDNLYIITDPKKCRKQVKRIKPFKGVTKESKPNLKSLKKKRTTSKLAIRRSKK